MSAARPRQGFRDSASCRSFPSACRARGLPRANLRHMLTMYGVYAYDVSCQPGPDGFGRANRSPHGGTVEPERRPAGDRTRPPRSALAGAGHRGRPAADGRRGHRGRHDALSSEERLGAEAMSLYRHVADKEVAARRVWVDRVFLPRSAVPSHGGDWKSDMRRARYFCSEGADSVTRGPLGCWSLRMQPGPAATCSIQAMQCCGWWLLKAGLSVQPTRPRVQLARQLHLGFCVAWSRGLPFSNADEPWRNWAICCLRASPRTPTRTIAGSQRRTARKSLNSTTAG